MWLKRTSVPIIILVSMAVTLFLGLMAMLFRQESVRQKFTTEFYAFQTMTALLDLHSSRTSIDLTLWPDVRGFGIYSPVGSSVFRIGTAPEVLLNAKKIPIEGLSVQNNGNLTLVRRIGTALPPQAEPSRNTRIMKMMDFMRDKRLLYIEIDVSNQMRRTMFVFALLVLSILFFIFLISVVITYSRKLASYRQREEATNHLIQLGEAARTLSHEIKNPLGVIRVQCATLERSVASKYQKNIMIIKEETERLVSLTDKVREFLQTSQGNPVLCDAVDLCRQCDSRYEGQLIVDIWDKGALMVVIDPARMMQVLDNLIVNAIEATAHGDLPKLTLYEKKGFACFSVEDSGIGVSLKHRPLLFTPFFTTKVNGSGIGLALSRRIMEQAKGSLEYSERSGGGSIFTACVPRGVAP